MKSKMPLLILVAATMVLVGCNKPKPSDSGASGDSSADVLPEITGIKLAAKSLELAVGEQGGLKAVVEGTGDFDASVKWSVEDAEVASVAEDGVVTGLKIGKTKLTAKTADEKFSADAELEIVAPSASITGNRTDVELEVDDEFQLLYKVKARGTIADTYTLESSNPAIAEVDATGKVTANAIGDATITAKTVDDHEFKTYIYVRDPYVKTIRLSSDSIYVRKGEEQKLSAEVNVFGDADDTVSWLSQNPAIATVDANGKVSGIEVGTTKIIASAGDVRAECDVVVAAEDAYPVANGAYTYVYSSGAERQKILGALEKWAVENKLTGLTLYGDGGYVMYNPRVQKGSETYIPGFGFGILSEGDLNADLATETNAAWKRYYHSYESADPSSLNYMDDKGSVVGDLIGYVASSYFDIQMNAEKTGYKWVKSLADVDRPIPVDLDNETGMAKTFKFPVKVGSALKYATNTQDPKLAAFNGREVALEDYITPYKIYYTQAYGLARSAENLSGASSLKGSKAYYDASEKGFNAEAWKGIGIDAKVDETDGKSYLYFTFNNACTPFYAMYYLSSGMFAPVPQAFIEALGTDLADGVKTWGKFSADGKLSPLDTYLSTGPYTVERWDKDQQIVFKKNPAYAEFIDPLRYNIPGIHLNILAAVNSDPEAAFNEFIAGKIDACGIPSTKLAKYKSDPRTTQTSDSSTYKLNMNTCTAEQWELLFGENGSIVQTPRSQYWKVEPAMSNKDFLSGISFALDRKSLAESIGRTPTGNFFGSAYMQDPENGISYNSTQEHADAVKSLQEGTDGFGYSLEKAKAAFARACEQLIAEGVYKAGDTIELEIAWQTNAQEAQDHNPIKKNLEDAFKDLPLKLNVKFWAGAVWSDVYYNKMMVGQFDIGFGSVSGNTYNPLNFMEVLKSDNSAGFTLNWGVDTNSVDGTIIYDDKVWSYDALWTCADQGGYVENGQNAPLYSVISAEALVQADGSLLVYLYVDEKFVDNDTYSMLYAICLYATTDSDNTDYSEYYVYAYLFDDDGNQTGLNPNFAYNETEGRYEILFTKEEIAAWLAAYPDADVYAQGIDSYFVVSLLGDANLVFGGTVWEGSVVAKP